MGIPTTSLRNYQIGEQKEIVFCTYKTKDISNDRVNYLMDEMADEYSKYNIIVRHAWNKTIEMKGASNSEIFQSLAIEELSSPCDRRLVFLTYSFFDVLFALAGVDVLGAVETSTMTTGYIIANYSVSINQLVMSPRTVIRHESLHLLGCEHGLDRGKCYDQIVKLREQKSSDFFPSYSAKTKEYFLTREHVNNQLQKHRKPIVISLNVNTQLQKPRRPFLSLTVNSKNYN